ncbi:hypothetical protein PG997_008206 [Apiospora hydei]|uniref:BZIP domain-containing protein n=1 Tax=Apiospora hydei TaxID=1337664 RepID=A0ABR1WE54_9PEZI
MSSSNGAQNNFTSVNNSSQQQYAAQSQAPHQAQGQQQQHAQDRPNPSRRKLPTLGHGLLPLDDGLSVQEYERRRIHNNTQAEENKRLKRQRNNDAARRSRLRRLNLIDTLTEENQRLKEENGALVRERDYWKGIVDRMQGLTVGGGHAQQTQQVDRPVPQQHSTPSQGLAYPAALTPQTAMASAALLQLSATPAPRQQAHTSRVPAAQSQMMSQFPAQARGPAPARAGTTTRTSAASGRAGSGFAGPSRQTAASSAGTTTASDIDELFLQIAEYDEHVRNEQSDDPLANFDFSTD